MSKYIALKEMPFIKVGDIINVELIEGRNGITTYYDKEIVCIQSGLEIVLLKEGWIEEVKPREFTIALFTDGSYGEYTDDAAARKYKHEVIKVREVFE